MKKMRKLLAVLLTVAMAGSMFTGCGAKDAAVTLTVYSQTANYSGEMQGWFAKILKDRFNVKVNLISDGEGVYETRMEAGDLGDLVIWGTDGKDYQQAVSGGLLYDWEEENLVQEYGPNINENMQYALEKNKLISGTNTVYGFGHNVAPSPESHDAFFYTWDIRWDLYEQLGHPEVKNLEDMISLFEKMKELCPTDENGNPTYAMSLWPDWDGNYVMYAKAMATAYYGYDEMGFGLYNTRNGEFYDALAADGPYLEMLKFFNTLYNKGLLDPDSMTQTYDKMIEKVQNGGIFFSIFNYAGSLGYNKQEYYDQNKIMKPLVPGEASPIVYGMSVYGGNRIWSIGAKTQYPELCMQIIDYLTTPQGRLETDYGPKELCWDYDENGKTFFTEFGKQCYEDRTTMMPTEWGGATFNDGAMQMNNTTWSIDAINPESGETYNTLNWASMQIPDGYCEADRDWRSFTGCTTINQYLEKGNYVVAPATTYAESKKSAELEVTWEQVKTCITDNSWKAIYANSDEEFNKIVNEMRGKAKQYGYDKCIEWCRQEAAARNELETPLR